MLGFFKDAESAEAKAYLQAAAVLDDQVDKPGKCYNECIIT